MYSLIGLNIGKDVRQKFIKYCQSYSNEVPIVEFCESKTTYLDILDTDDMMIERLHILQLVELLEHNPALYEELFLWNPYMSAVDAFGKIFRKWLLHGKSNVLHTIVLPYKGLIYYVPSKCKKYIAVASLYAISNKDGSWDTDCSLDIEILSRGINQPIADSNVNYSLDARGNKRSDRCKLLLFVSASDDSNGNPEFFLMFSDKSQDRRESVLSYAVSDFKNCKVPVIASRAKEVGLVTKGYKNFINSPKFEDYLVSYKSKLIFNE